MITNSQDDQSASELAILLDRSQPSGRRVLASTRISGPLDNGVIARLVEHLQTADEVDAFNIAAVLAQTKSKHVTPPLLRVLVTNSIDHVRIAAIHALQRIPDNRAAPDLVAIAKNRRNSVSLRAKAYDALSPFVKTRYVQSALLRGLHDASPNIRYYCLVALSGTLHDESVRAAVNDLVNDSADTWEGRRIDQAACEMLANWAMEKKAHRPKGQKRGLRRPKGRT